MVYIFYTKSASPNPKYLRYLDQVPEAFQEQILKYRNWKDGQRSLFGKLLLKRGLQLLGLKEYQLSDIKYSPHQRPYLDTSLDFNIAHSGDYVVCAISKINKVGVDIEELKSTELRDFHPYFTHCEWTNIVSANESLHAFYTLWTQKEAIIKASGEGLTIPLHEVIIQNDKAVVWNDTWHLTPLPLNQQYVSYLATDSKASEMVLRKIDFD